MDYRKTERGFRPEIVAFFPDKRHGGRRAAWLAAEKYATKARRALKR